MEPIGSLRVESDPCRFFFFDRIKVDPFLSPSACNRCSRSLLRIVVERPFMRSSCSVQSSSCNGVFFFIVRSDGASSSSSMVGSTVGNHVDKRSKRRMDLIVAKCVFADRLAERILLCRSAVEKVLAIGNPVPNWGYFISKCWVKRSKCRCTKDPFANEI